jgi:hypothetical protein
MADLIELDVVVRQKGLKESLTTVERLERQLTNAAKAVEQNRISQDRYNKILLSAKRQYEALGVSSQKATASVRKFSDAQRQAAKDITLATVAIKGNVQAQMAATKGSNQFGVVTQQAGYQVSDFIVQVQSGTNAFVAFGQQASQLVGVLPLIASPLGLTAGAAVALSAGLGIAIPLVTAIGAAFTRSAKDAKDAADGLKTYEEALDGLSKKADQLRNKRLSLTTEFDEDALIASQKRVELANIIAQKQIDQVGLTGTQLELSQNLIDTLEEQLGKETKIVENAIERVRKEEERLQKAKEAAEWEAGAEERRLAFLERRDGFLEYFNAQIEANAKAEEEALAKAEKLEKGRAKATEDRFNALMKSIAANDAANARAEQQQAAANQSAEEQLKILEQQNAVIERQIVFGKDSTEAERLKGQHIVDNLRSNLEKKGVDEDIIVALIEQQQLLLSNKEILSDQVEEAKKLKEALTPVTAQYLLDKGILPPQAAKDFETVNEAEEEFLSDKRAAARKRAEEQAKKYAKALEDQERAAEKLRQELEGPMVSAIDGVSNAFGDFIARGLTDFKGFVKQILGSFQNMVAQMIATAARNKIMLSLGLGGSTLAGQAAAGQLAGVGGASAAGPIGSFIGSFAGAGAAGTGVLGGIGSVFGSSGIGLSGSFNALGSMLGGGSLGGGFTLGAAIPAIAAVAVVVGLLTKKTKLLDSGLRATVEGFDVAIETFKKTQTSRLFGLLKSSPKTAYEAASADVADPLIEAIGDMQQSIVDAAGTLGIGADAFDNFSYQFKLSLKGLTEEEQLQKINEEITKMGDSFASLSGHFETMNELLAAATQRYDLETRVLQLLGNETELLIRQRERERAATHELNRGMLDQVYALEDAYSAVNSAFATVQRSIEARKAAITSSFNDIMDAIQSRLAVAQSAVGVSGGILSSLEGASGTSGMTRGAGLAYLRSLRGASRISDQKKLDDALQAIAEPSEGLYKNFVDYQRDFADQRNLIRELEEKAGHQLSTDEQTLLEIQSEAEAAQARYDGQIDKLDEQLAQAQEQLNALYGIDTSIKDVDQAIRDLSTAVLAAIDAQAAAKAALRGAGTGAGAGVQQANAAGQQILNQLGQSGIAERKSDGAKFQKVNIRGSSQLLQVASDLGVKTSGKTGAQIQQAISNAGNLGVNMDNATRALQFAMGGNFGGGLRMVGERGPELEATGPSRIFSTKQTAELFRNPELVAEVRSLREEVAGLRTESRQLQASNSKYVKRNYDINRKWDTEGLPATRT